MQEVVIYPGGILWWICVFTLAYIVLGILMTIGAIISAVLRS